MNQIYIPTLVHLSGSHQSLGFHSQGIIIHSGKWLIGQKHKLRKSIKRKSAVLQKLLSGRGVGLSPSPERQSQVTDSACGSNLPRIKPLKPHVCLCTHEEMCEIPAECGEEPKLQPLLRWSSHSHQEDKEWRPMEKPQLLSRFRGLG